MAQLDIVQSTHEYETWLGKHVSLHAPDLREKHQRMAAAAFAFLRATFYRWGELFPATLPELAKAPTVLAIGDLHIENFGTWRDTEGRLVWGTNDFDEAHPLPYTMDLVRLATSACLAIAEAHLDIRLKAACGAILDGYVDGIEAGGKPVVLGERHAWLRQIARKQLKDPVAFWDQLQSLPAWRGAVPREARRALEQMLPEERLAYKLSHRSAGMGSRGRPRFVAIADWRGGHIARETKPLVPSVCSRAVRRSARRIYYADILRRSVRCHDPYVRLQGAWITRRLAPDCTKIELAALPTRDEARLLHAMGWETANVHLGSQQAIVRVRRDLAERRPSWLRNAAKAMVEVTLRDWKDWRNR